MRLRSSAPSTQYRLATRYGLATAAFALLAAAGTAGGPAHATEGYALGDSIAAAMAQTIGMKGAAHHSVSLRRNAVAPQFTQLPKGAIAIMSLGLNDAAIPVDAMRKDIEVVIEGVEKTGEKFIWVGPPCVLKSWDTRAKQMDDYLRQRLADTAIQYVSLRDPQICQRALRTSDGEHFTDAGYRYLWLKIQRDSSYAAEVEMGRQAVAQAAIDAKPKTQPTAFVYASATKTKPRKKRRLRKREWDDE